MRILKNKFIFVARHGERADMIENVNKEQLKCGIYDSELTIAGKEESFRLGNAIRKFIIDNDVLGGNISDVKNYKILSSPFVRTITTTTNILRGMGLTNNVNIVIENGLCEKMNVKWYPFPPESFLTINKKEDQGNKFLANEVNNYNIIKNRSLLPLPKHP